MKDYTKYKDTELVKLLTECDDMAFREIYNRYNQLLYIFAYRKLNNEQEAQDVVHDVFAWMFEKGKNIDLKLSLSSYLYKSVLNRIYDKFRKNDLFQRYILENKHFIDLENRETDYLIREKDITLLIENEISNMSPRMQEVYRLKYYNYLDNNQIAEELNISLETVKTHLKLATRHLRKNVSLIVFLFHIINR